MNTERTQAFKAEISAKVKEKKGNTTYYQVTKKSGLTNSQIKSIEVGKQYTIDSLIKLCDALELKLTIE